MYEDDGSSYEYEKGAIASTKFECIERGKEIEFTIYLVEGRFNGIPESRDYELEFLTNRKPARIAVDGKNIKDWSYNEGKIRLTLDSLKITHKVVVSIKY